MKTLKKGISMLLIALTISACSSDDDKAATQDFLTISFEDPAFEAEFYQSGSTDIVNVTSSLGEPSIVLSDDTDVTISYNEMTGQVEWTNLLPLGINNVTLIATADDGTKASVDITIENILQGNFSGGYNFNADSTVITSSDYAMSFNRDGTMTINDEGQIGSGTWASNGNQILFTITYNANPDNHYTFNGTIVHNEIEVSLSGLWYKGETVNAEMVEGYYNVNFQEL